MKTVSLGIDIGTTKVALVAREVDSGKVRYSGSLKTNSDIAVKQERSEQDVVKILDAVYSAFKDIPQELRNNVAAIGVSGQMHGVMLWNSGSLRTSSLITWQDGRASADGVLGDIQKVAGADLKDGYGFTSLSWIKKFRPELLREFENASTIHDYCVSLFCNHEKPVTDPTNAASWGLFDIDTMSWDLEKVDLLRIPKDILPELIQTGSIAGYVSDAIRTDLGLKQRRIPVTVAIGDNQAGLYSIITDPQKQLALSLGTSAQLSAVLDRNAEYSESVSQGCELRPYVDDQLIAVAAALSGGNTLGFIAQQSFKLINDLGLVKANGRTVSSDEIIELLSNQAINDCSNQVKAKPYFIGERFNPQLRAEITNMNASTSLADITRAMIEAVVVNVRDMLPAQLRAQKNQILGSGGMLRKNLLVQKTVEEKFGMPLILANSDLEEAANGAAKLAARILK